MKVFKQMVRKSLNLLHGMELMNSGYLFAINRSTGVACTSTSNDLRFTSITNCSFFEGFDNQIEIPFDHYEHEKKRVFFLLIILDKSVNSAKPRFLPFVLQLTNAQFNFLRLTEKHLES